MFAKINQELLAAKARRKERRGLVRHLKFADRDLLLGELRQRAAARKREDKNFEPLSEYELALVEWKIGEYQDSQRLIVLDDIFPYHFEDPLARMRQNHIMGTQEISPKEFRAAAHQVMTKLFEHALHRYELEPEETATLFMWRAALLGADAAFGAGIKAFFHVDANRNEGSARCSAPRYFEAPDARSTWKKVFVLDTMCASGGSDECSIRQLIDYGVAEKDIIVLAAIAAPEGVDHILHHFPKVQMMTVALDERLNSKAYIEIGLGDAGDQGFADFTPEDAARWYDMGIVSGTGLVKLQQRIRNAAIAAT